MRWSLLLLLGIFCVGTPAQAQMKKFARALKEQPLYRWVFRAQLPATKIERSVFRLAPAVPKGDLPNLKATAFALEETYQGKKYVWGISATHYDFDSSILELDGKAAQPVFFALQGSKYLNDVSVFPLSPEVAQKLTPLQLASQRPQLGEELYSGGYFFDGRFRYEANRIVKAQYPHRMITSLQIEAGPYREGACGSPIVNKRGEVVGMHVGSSVREQVGYAVTLDDIRSVLQALHQGNELTEPLFFNGKEIGQLHINEGIFLIEALKSQEVVARTRTYHIEKQVDYDHLENLIHTSEADRVVFYIEKKRFPMEEPGPGYDYTVLIYDLSTGQVSWVFRN